MFLLLLLLLTPLPSLSESDCNFQSSITASFSSWNFNNNLTWIPPENSKGLLYSVEYKEYGSNEWQKKLECTDITQTWCDLTNETSKILVERNKEIEYFGKVIIKNETCSTNITTDIFKLKFQTEIGPPTVHLFPGDDFIEISLTHPVKFLHEIFKGLTYKIFLNNKLLEETEEPYYRINHIYPNTTYCIAAQVLWITRTGHKSKETCITTKADRTSQQAVEGIIYVLSMLFIICTGTAFGYFIHKYISGSNPKQPNILNITAHKNRNAIWVEAHTVTINLITIEPGKPNVQEIMMSGKEETKELNNQPDLPIIHVGDYINCDSGVTKEAGEESDDDHGYVSLYEHVQTARPTISPYDMPHNLCEPVRPLLSVKSTEIVCKETDLYGQIKSNASVSSIQENDNEDIVPNEYTSEKKMDNYPYVPQGDCNFPTIGKLQDDLCELEDSTTDQEINQTHMIEDTDHNESGMLFIDWSPSTPPLYIPSLSKKRELEYCIRKCQEEKESLLSQLYLPNKEKETAEDDRLGQLEERWGLIIPDTEK
ncbi:interleukin-20 receptor subunit alpha-like [Pyxicephalus adspersus]|uniref:interleukin-20 receptor subunit alpha-like n=1 Tax=Pyxicephalus adspersus TaxID=30357 RepID=UPI003B5CCC50